MNCHQKLQVITHGTATEKQQNSQLNDESKWLGIPDRIATRFYPNGTVDTYESIEKRSTPLYERAHNNGPFFHQPDWNDHDSRRHAMMEIADRFYRYVKYDEIKHLFHRPAGVFNVIHIPKNSNESIWRLKVESDSIWWFQEGSFMHYVHPPLNVSEWEGDTNLDNSLDASDTSSNTVMLKSLICHDQEDSDFDEIGIGDRLILEIVTDGLVHNRLEREMSTGDIWNLQLRVKFDDILQVNLVEQNLFEADSNLGSVSIDANTVISSDKFNRDPDALYELNWASE